MPPKALLWFAFLFLGLTGPNMAQGVSEPPYTLVKNEPPFEVRDYGVLTVAETVIEGDFDVAGSLGFRRVAGYIFGKNWALIIPTSGHFALSFIIIVALGWDSNSGLLTTCHP